MNTTLLDFSQRRDLTLHARVIADVQRTTSALDVPIMIVGAFARDLHVFSAHSINVYRESVDLDLAIAVSDWKSFNEIKTRLTEAGTAQAVPGVHQRLRHSSGLPLDLVPFRGVETDNRRIEWPPNGDVVMDVFGLAEALTAAQPVRLPEDVQSTVVSLPALALLKIVAWKDRHLRHPRKDADDLMLIASNYLGLGNRDRLWNEFSAWAQEDDFDYELCGGRMLGCDIGALLAGRAVGRVTSILEEQVSETFPGLLPAEMSPRDAERARRLLSAVLTGMIESR